MQGNGSTFNAKGKVRGEPSPAAMWKAHPDFCLSAIREGPLSSSKSQMLVDTMTGVLHSQCQASQMRAFESCLAWQQKSEGTPVKRAWALLYLLVTEEGLFGRRNLLLIAFGCGQSWTHSIICRVLSASSRVFQGILAFKFERHWANVDNGKKKCHSKLEALPHIFIQWLSSVARVSVPQECRTLYVSHQVGSKNPHTLGITWCLPGCWLAGSWIRSRGETQT